MEDQRSIIFSVKALTNQIHRRMDRKAVSKGVKPLTGMQHGVLRFVGKRMGAQDVFQKDIEQHFNIRRSTATGILQLMEKNDLIKRIPVPHDARLKKIVLTEKSQKNWEDSVSDFAELEELIKQDISAEELNVFFKVIDKVTINIKKEN